MQAIIHIGLHKTGSTAIQTFLARNAAALSDQGYYYEPTLPDWPNQNPLADAFRVATDHSLGERLLTELIAKSGERTLLISSEMLCEPQIDSDHFLDLLSGWKKRVVAYIRHPCDIVLAAFCEQVKHYPNRYVRGINEFPLAYDPGQLDVLQHWLNRSDIELIIAPYDQRQWLHGSLFSDFVNMIGVSSHGIDMADIRINESLSFASSEILRLSLVGGLPEEIFDIMLQHVRRTDRKDVDYPLTAETIAVCRERMTETIELYRPFLRSGFDDSYLFEKRPR